MKSFKQFISESTKDVGGGWVLHRSPTGFGSLKKRYVNPVARARGYEADQNQKRIDKANYDAGYLNRDKEGILTSAKSTAKYGHLWDAQNAKDQAQFGKSYRQSKADSSAAVLKKAQNWDKQAASPGHLEGQVQHILSLPHDHPELKDFN